MLRCCVPAAEGTYHGCLYLITIRFCGVCLDAPEAPLVVMEYYKNGSVFSLLSKASEDHRNTSDPAAHQEVCTLVALC